MEKLRVLAVAGSLNEKSATRVVVREAAAMLAESGAETDLLDFVLEPVGLFNPESTYAAAHYPELKTRVDRADVILLGTPDYHGSMSGALKNFLDHFWTEFAGKLFVSIVGSYEKGLTVTDQIRTVARQCYAWSLPYGLSFVDKEDVKDGAVVGRVFHERLEMMSHDVMSYGGLIAAQRREDLAGRHPGFMARYRK